MTSRLTRYSSRCYESSVCSSAEFCQFAVNKSSHEKEGLQSRTDSQTIDQLLTVGGWGSMSAASLTASVVAAVGLDSHSR